MKDFEEIFMECAADFVDGDEFKRLLSERLERAIAETLDSSLRWGDLGKALRDRMSEVLVPQIERWDMGAYAAKLDVLLGEIAEQTALADVRKTLGNFAGMMADPDRAEIPLEDVFEAYKKFVAANATGAGLEVFDGVYEPLLVSCDVSMLDKPGWSSLNEVVVDFYANTPDEDECDNLSRRVCLWSLSADPGGSYRIFSPRDTSIEGISRMSSFDVLLARLERGHVTVTGVDRLILAEQVNIDAEPEYELR